ncbi:MAG: bifunctional DNA primase/polymerase [Rhizobiaceae bacterium]|nr:bifunctional DNA primase/polymerase [Rhizobiaceae bacterium]
MNAITTNARLEHALALARRGFRVFPLAPNSKIPPAGLLWKQAATTDSAQIRRWWQGEPTYNIGVATGYGLLVVDADVRDGAPGLGSLAMLDRAGLPESFRVETPSGGRHVYLRTAGEHRNRVKNIPGYPGIDLRGTGGYVVGPGSVFEGKSYCALGGEIEPAGEWFESVLSKGAPFHREASDATPRVALDLEQNVRRAIHYLSEQAPKAVEGEGGDGTTYRVAAKLRDFGVSKETALELLLEHWNEQKASPPWMPDDLSLKVENAFSYATGSWGGRTAAAEFEALDIDVGESPIRPAEPEPAAEAAETKQLPKEPHWRFETIGDLRKLPAAKWLVKDWIPESSTGILYGKYGAGKTFVGFDLALALAYGQRDWHGAQLPGVPCRVLVIAREGKSGFLDRIGAWKHHHGIENDTDLLEFMRAPVSFANDSQFDSFATAVKARGQYRLILVDTVGRVLPGADMMTSEQVTIFMDRCGKLTHDTGAATIGVHHANKSGAMYGSVYFGAHADFVFEVKRTGNEDEPLRRGEIFCEKMKDGPDRWRRYLSYEHIQTDDNPLEPAGSLVLTTLRNTAAEGHNAEAAWQAICQAHATGAPWSKHARARESGRYAAAKIGHQLGIGEAVAAALVDKLLSERRIEERTNAKTKTKFLAPATLTYHPEVGGDAA